MRFLIKFVCLLERYVGNMFNWISWIPKNLGSNARKGTKCAKSFFVTGSNWTHRKCSLNCM